MSAGSMRWSSAEMTGKYRWARGGSGSKVTRSGFLLTMKPSRVSISSSLIPPPLAIGGHGRTVPSDMPSDEREILNLLHRYCELQDAADFVGVSELFRHSVYAVAGGDSHHGYDEVYA